MTDFQKILLELNENLATLLEREASHAGNAPLDLLNQIRDHRAAIELTEQASAGDISEAEWQAALEPLLVSLHRQQVVFNQQNQQIKTQTNVAGNLVQIYQTIYQQPPPTASITLTEAEQHYRERIKTRFAEEATFFVPLAGETTEVVSPTRSELQASRSARRRKQRAEYHEWIQTEKEIKRVKLNTLREGVEKYPCVILLGDPGSGKTTALENLAWQFAGEASKLPVPLRLSEFRPEMSVEKFLVQGWGGSLAAGHWGAPELANNLDVCLEEGRLFFLLDALNEMPRQKFKEHTRTLRQFIDTWSEKGNRFLVTCRVLDYGEELAGLQRIEVQPFTDDQIRDFLRNELVEDWERMWQALVEQQDHQRRLLEMARNPYVLTMMIDVFSEDGRLGQNRAQLMHRFTQILMGWAEEKCPPEHWISATAQQASLAALAFEAQRQGSVGTMVETEQVKGLMPPQVQPDPTQAPVSTPPEQVLNLAAAAKIIEMPVDRSSVRFYHQLLQEYFAAQELLKRKPEQLVELWQWPWLETAAYLPWQLSVRTKWYWARLGSGTKEMPRWEQPEGSYDPLPPPPPTGWEETTILAAGLRLENENQLIRLLTPINPVLAGRCLHEGRAQVDTATRQAVIDALLQTISRPEVALRVRIAAGEVLGYLGDPRLGELVTIPAGEFVMGKDEEQHRLHLPEFQIGKYPVTNAEYTDFIEAGGYSEPRWWTEAGRQQRNDEGWTEPRYWRDLRFNAPNRPVVGVSWYEALAYCRWQTEQLANSDQLSRFSGLAGLNQQSKIQNRKSKIIMRLPSEAEWEKAARGPSTGSGEATDGRTYPWGNRFDPTRLNVSQGDQQVRTTTPVGIYATGVGPNGLYDSAGNAWEWTTSMYKNYPYDPTDGREDLGAGTDVLRVVRGGSWINDWYYARCASRFRYFPFYWDFNRGFRVVVVVAPRGA